MVKVLRSVVRGPLESYVGDRVHEAEPGNRSNRAIRSCRASSRARTGFYDDRDDNLYDGPELTPPASHPDDPPVPGPAGRVPENWRDLIH